MKNILAIIKKEFFRFFKDKRLLFTTLIMPGLMIFVVYSIMGEALNSSFGADNSHEAIVYVNEMPSSIESLLDASQVKIKKNSYIETEIDDIKKMIVDKEADLLIIFPENFDEVVANYKVGEGDAPNIKIYYSSVNTESTVIYNTITLILDEYEKSLVNKFDINSGEDFYDLSTTEDVTGTIYSMMLPFLILTFLFSACMSLAPEAIAGEKERGTIATLLVTPIKRSELAIGKIVSLSVVAILSALSSFIGTIASLPSLMGISGEESISANAYGIIDYFYILLIILSTVLVVISIMSILSAIAKSIKEASTIISPLMIVTMLIGITSMFGSVSDSKMLYLIPIYNSVQAMGGIFSFSPNIVCILITVISNIIYSSIFVFILTKIFNNEKIMFSK